MKKSFASLLLFIACISYSLEISGQSVDSIDVNLYSGEHEQHNNNGRRKSPRPILCRIDFESSTIIIDENGLSEDVLAYELWDEGGRYAITVSSDETVFVETIKSLQNGVYILKVITIDKTLKGYLYL